MSEMSEAHLAKMHSASHLLPDPGGEVARELISEVCTLRARLSRLSALLDEAEAALGPFAKVANEIRKGARTTQWLETPLFYCGDIHDPQKWTITGRGFDRAASVSKQIAKMKEKSE